MSIFRIDMLPAREGDCLWIEYGEPDRPYRILVDGGRRSAWKTIEARLQALPAEQRQFELLVLTHIDADHIEGLLAMVEQDDPPVSFKDVWFNGYRHLRPAAEEMGAVQAETLTEGLLRHAWPWNAAFAGGSVVIPDEGALPMIELAGGMRLTLLSPDWSKLCKLRPVWENELAKAGLIPGKAEAADIETPGIEAFGALDISEILVAAASSFKPDESEANGSSIAFIAEFAGRRAILTGDAHVDRMLKSLSRLNGGEPVSVDAYKLSHHGSRGTHSVDLMRLVRSSRFLVSTDGSRHGHPHDEAIARTVANAGGPVELVFNYDGDISRRWFGSAARKHFDFEATFPDTDTNGVKRVEL